MITQLRSTLLHALLSATRPRCVLVDHLPNGKRNELQQALGSKTGEQTWILGMRAVTGDAADIWSRESQSAFQRHFNSLLWYGSTSVTGSSTFMRLRNWFGIEPVEVGYVSRALELERAGLLQRYLGRREGVVIAITSRDETTGPLLRDLAQVASIVKDEWGEWQVFLPEGGSGEQERVMDTLARSGATVLPLSERYLTALQRARIAVVHGGYNTLTDLVWAGTPGVVVMRWTKDGEQYLHATAFARASGGMVVLDSSAGLPNRTWLKLLEDTASCAFVDDAIPLTGAEMAAEHMVRLIVG